jgi:GH24 family phage-related lysozyme (muramidase)
MSRPLITEGKRLISGAEACKLKPYQGSADPAGTWTIGWGHVIGLSEKYLMAGITQAKADAMFAADVESHIKFIQSDIGSKIVLDDYEYAACASFAFNNGARVFTVAPSIVNNLRAGKRAEAFINFYKFCKSGEPLVYRDGLIYRRLVESILALDKKLVAKPHECIGARKLIADLSKHGSTSELLGFFNSHHRKDLCVTCKSKH